MYDKCIKIIIAFKHLIPENLIALQKILLCVLDAIAVLIRNVIWLW